MEQRGHIPHTHRLPLHEPPRGVSLSQIKNFEEIYEAVLLSNLIRVKIYSKIEVSWDFYRKIFPRMNLQWMVASLHNAGSPREATNAQRLNPCTARIAMLAYKAIYRKKQMLADFRLLSNVAGSSCCSKRHREHNKAACE